MLYSIYSTATAAVRLGLSVATVKYHLYVAKDLEPDSVFAGRLQFTEETLVKFLAHKRGPGRPRKNNVITMRNGSTITTVGQGGTFKGSDHDILIDL